MKDDTIYTVLKAHGLGDRSRLTDMAVLPDDMLSIDPKRIKDASVEMTIVGGKIVFDRTGPQPVILCVLIIDGMIFFSFIASGVRQSNRLTGHEMSEYNGIIEDLVANRWLDGQSGKTISTDIHSVVIEEDLDGAEARLVANLGFRGRLAVVSDVNTYDAMGKRVARRLKEIGAVETVVLDSPHADLETVRRVRVETRSADCLIAVGSGTINDLCKHAAFLDSRRYAVFATAASMNGYATSTASITVDGFKHSLPTRMPAGVFMDLKVISSAPVRLGRSGLGDSLCRSTAQLDWLLSHRLLGTYYNPDPFRMQAEDEEALLKESSGLNRGDVESFRRLCRVLILCGLGTCVTGTSHHGSMSEHLISHYIDTFAGRRHPGSLHGEQVGVASLSMNRLQHRILDAGTPPRLRPTRIDGSEMRSRCGPAMADQCLSEFGAKAFDKARSDAVSETLAEQWPNLQRELQAVMLPGKVLERALRQAGARRTAGDLGISPDFYREALIHAREIRNRFTILDIAADAGLLEEFAAGDC